MRLFDVRTPAPASDLALLALRLVAGLSLALAHGVGKLPPSEGFIARVDGMGFPLPLLFAWLAATAELGGGLLIAAGLLTRVAALFVTGNMVMIMFIALAGQPFSEREKPLLFFGIALYLLVAGPGRYSLDAVAGRVLSRGRPMVSGRS